MKWVILLLVVCSLLFSVVSICFDRIFLKLDCYFVIHEILTYFLFAFSLKTIVMHNPQPLLSHPRHLEDHHLQEVSVRQKPVLVIVGITMLGLFLLVFQLILGLIHNHRHKNHASGDPLSVSR